MLSSNVVHAISNDSFLVNATLLDEKIERKLNKSRLYKNFYPVA